MTGGKKAIPVPLPMLAQQSHAAERIEKDLPTGGSAAKMRR
jgi:hypothetical protein